MTFFENEKSNHGQVGHALYLKFTMNELKDRFGLDKYINLQDGVILKADELNKLTPLLSSIDIHIDDQTKGNYECICEHGVEIH